MREILFRGKDAVNGEWLNGDLARRNSRVEPKLGSVGIVDEHGNYRVVENATIGQFTGLTDKNGKRIFEGDIVKDNKNIGIIKYFESIGCFVVIVGNDIWNLNENDPNRQTKLQYTEIIGNIHDNPEFLEVTC